MLTAGRVCLHPRGKQLWISLVPLTCTLKQKPGSIGSRWRTRQEHQAGGGPRAMGTWGQGWGGGPSWLGPPGTSDGTRLGQAAGPVACAHAPCREAAETCAARRTRSLPASLGACLCLEFCVAATRHLQSQDMHSGGWDSRSPPSLAEDSRGTIWLPGRGHCRPGRSGLWAPRTWSGKTGAPKIICFLNRCQWKRLCYLVEPSERLKGTLNPGHECVAFPEPCPRGKGPRVGSVGPTRDRG